MSEVPPSQDQRSEIDDLYRRLSALDPGRPGEWVRRKVQAYAAQQAAERALRASAKAKEGSGSEAPTPRAPAIPTAAKQTANKPWLLPVTVGTIAAAALVGFLVVPRLMAPRDTPKTAISPAPASQPETATPQVAHESAPPSSESVSLATPSPPLQSSEPELPSPPPPVPQSPATTSPPVAPRSSAPPAPVVASQSAGTPPAQSLTQARVRVARQNTAALHSAPIATDSAETATQASRPAPAADSAPAPQSPPVPSTDTPVASAPPPEATPSATQPSPTPAAASYPPDELWLAAQSGDMSGLQAALNANVDVNALDAKGQTALIIAIQSNHVAVVKALLAHGANPNTPNSRGLTPLRAARIRENFAILAVLERNGRIH